jgi:hypothetical protein
MLMSAIVTEALHDPELTWVAIIEAAQDRRDADLAEIAIGLYAQLGEARAEAERLKAALRAALQALAPSRLGGWG